MCRKKDSALISGQRITADNLYWNDTLDSKSVHTYNGNLITAVISYTPDMEEVTKTEFLYSGNLIASFTEYDKSRGLDKISNG